MSEEKDNKTDLTAKGKASKVEAKYEARPASESEKAESGHVSKQDESNGGQVLPQSIESVLTDLTALANVTNTSTSVPRTFSFLPPHGRTLPPGPTAGMRIRLAELMAHVTKRKRRWKAFLNALSSNLLTISTPGGG
jgi:hypothetical protein